ncbi:MAG TPA: alpha-L-fucosidase [Verrucomicrobiae bacterium]|jgi:alpha-L-fucosidase
MKSSRDRLALTLTALGLIFAARAFAAEYIYDWDSLKRAPIPQWFDDGKFGIFIHWGAYSVAGFTPSGRGYAEHFPSDMYESLAAYYPFLKKRFGAAPPDFGYKDIVPLFKAENWHPEAWARLFKRAGARYIVLTGEHHDGFAMWDSDLTGWCAAKMGPKRDLVGDLAKAVRAEGLKFAPSYHRERHPGFFAMEPFVPESQPRPDVAEEIRRQPAAAQLYGPFAYSDAFIADYAARWQELQRKYHPDFMWIDNIPLFYKVPNNPQTRKFKDACLHMIVDYLNSARERGQEVYFNNKGAYPNWPDGVGCREKDNLKLPAIGPKWQNPATLGTSYGYLKAEDEKDAYKSPGELIRLLCDVVSKNGNLLLNIGPRADGSIPDAVQRRLLAIGDWLAVNGQSIYGTRPWKTCGEACAIRNTNGVADIRFTRSKDNKTLYAIVLGGQKAGETLTISSLSPAGVGYDWPVSNVELLGAKEIIQWKRAPFGLTITFPKKMPKQAALAAVFRIN